MLKILSVAFIALTLAAPAAPAIAAPTALELYAQSCVGVFNMLPRIVRKDAVAAIGPNSRVSIHSICEGVGLVDFGNAAGLGRTIAANRTLSAALARQGWRADDVTAMAINGSHVDLYVHRD